MAIPTLEDPSWWNHLLQANLGQVIGLLYMVVKCTKYQKIEQKS